MKKDFFIKNRNKLIEEMKEDSIAVIFSGQAPHRSADANYPFLVNRNFYYLTGLDQENIALVITKRKDTIQQELFIDQPDPVLEKWVGKKYYKEDAENISGIAQIQWVDKFEQMLTTLLDGYPYENIYLDLEKSHWDSPAAKGLTFSGQVKERFPYLHIKNVYPIIRDLRTIKEPEEIEKIQRAVDITKEGIDSLMKEMREGLRVYQLEAYFDFAIKYIGARGHAFPTIAAPGDKATILHYEEDQDILEDGQLVLFDLGADYQHYCGDISRTLPVSGRFTHRQKELYNIVLKANKEVIKAIKPGLPFTELNKIATKVLAEGCMEIGLITNPDEISEYYYHGVSHYLGLDTHDVGRRDRVLEPGMVLTVEPGLYVAEEKIGIRIEDDVLVTEDGNRVLSKDIPKEVEEIEKCMK